MKKLKMCFVVPGKTDMRLLSEKIQAEISETFPEIVKIKTAHQPVPQEAK